MYQTRMASSQPHIIYHIDENITVHSILNPIQEYMLTTIIMTVICLYNGAV